MLRLTIVLSALLLVQFATANPVELEREKLLKNAQESYVEFFKYACREMRALIENVLKDPRDAENFADQIKSYEDFLEETKDYETASIEELPEFFGKGTSLLSFESNLDFKDWATRLVFQKYEDLVVVNENVALRLFKIVENFSYQVRDYLGKLTPEQKKEEVNMIYWYDRFMHERNFETRLDMFSDFMELYFIPKSSFEIYSDKIVKSFQNYTIGLKKIADSVHEEKFSTEINKAVEYFESPTEDFDVFEYVAKFYVDFDKWLLEKGPSYFKYKKEIFKLSIQLLDDIDFYTDLYFQYADVQPKLKEWYEDLKKAENFEENFELYFKFFKVLEEISQKS